MNARKTGWRLLLAAFVLFQTLPALAQPREVRIPAGEVLTRASKAWEPIRDYQGTLFQIETRPDQTFKQMWIEITLVKPISNDPDVLPTFLAEFYEQPVETSQPREQRPEAKVVYYADQSEILYTYKPEAKSLVKEKLSDSGPLPEFLHIAGFLQFDIETLKEKAYLDDAVLEESIGDSLTWRVTITPRKKMRDLEPPRQIWIDQKTHLPKRLAVQGDFSVVIDFKDYKINQGLDPTTLVPEVPSDVYVNDKTALSTPQ